MATHKQALKRHRQSLKAKSRNRAVKTHMKNAIKAVHKAVEARDKEQAEIALKRANSILDKAASKKVIHWGHAARRISRLNREVNKLS